MKKLLITFVVALVIIVIAGAILFVWISNSDTRTYYQGYVQIEPIPMDSIIGRLEKAGCVGQSVSCHYVFDKEKNILNVNFFERGLVAFGPGEGIKISDGRLYANVDIYGGESLGRYKMAVKELIQRSGNVVNPIDDTWTILSTMNTTGMVY